MDADKLKGFAIIACIVCIVLFIIIIPIAYRCSSEIKEITVKDKERIDDDDDSKYLIFTEQGVFENTDSIMFFKWNSSDVYNQIEVGATYKVKVAGWRVPFLSWYENVIVIEEVIDEPGDEESSTSEPVTAEEPTGK